MPKSRWSVILPKRGNLTEILDFLHTLPAATLETVISGTELDKINQFFNFIKRTGITGDPGVKFTTFRPKKYEAALTAALPHCLQLPRSVYGESSLERLKPKRAEKLAEQELARQLMNLILGEGKVESSIGSYSSYSDLMFAHCHQVGVARPIYYTYPTHTSPKRCMSIVSCALITEPGLVTVKGGVCQTYGAALESSCVFLDKIVEQLKLRELSSKYSDSFSPFVT